VRKKNAPGSKDPMKNIELSFSGGVSILSLNYTPAGIHKHTSISGETFSNAIGVD